MAKIRLALAQKNFTVGDLEGNANRILETYKEAYKQDVDILAFPELCLTGYPPEDLLLKSKFLKDVESTLQGLLPRLNDMIVVLGAPLIEDDVYNTAVVIYDGKIAGTYKKIYLPNYGVFDENRYFQSGSEGLVLEIEDFKIGINICEDLWYPKGPAYYEALMGDAELILNLSSSPYHAGKSKDRQRMIATRSEDSASIIAYVNLVGAQDELVFDGNSLVMSEEGKILAKAAAFEEDLLILDLDRSMVLSRRLHDPRRRKAKRLDADNQFKINHIRIPFKPKSHKTSISPRIVPHQNGMQEIYNALKLGLQDYVRKNGFEKVVLGVSGGIDSALVAAIAADALGAENVIGISMPSQYTSSFSKTDAALLAKNLKIELNEIPILELVELYGKILTPFFKNRPEDETEENLQARIRGNLVMAFSNKFGYLALATGNKSETSVGYSTLYGDMVGGFSIIKDVPKTMVYELANYVNAEAGYYRIPERIITRPPSAELKPDQTDQDTLPPYDILDKIILQYVENDRPLSEIIGDQISKQMLQTVVKMINRNEYKRRQAAPGIKITPRSFGKDRRVPITNKYSEK